MAKKMTLQEFDAWALKQGSVAKYNDGQYKGQCVSLINQLCYRVFGIPADAWGHAVAWGYSNNAQVLKYFKPVSGTPQAGDVLVYPGTMGNGYGHIEYVGANGKAMFQNRNWNLRVGTGARLGGYYRILRSRKAFKVKPAPKKATTTYTVKRGDTLSSIAAKFKTTWQNLANLNGLRNANLIYPGQRLKVLSGQPASKVYRVVQKGDTLSNIAARYGTTWQAIAKLNNLRNPNIIHPGQKLRVK